RSLLPFRRNSPLEHGESRRLRAVGSRLTRYHDHRCGARRRLHRDGSLTFLVGHEFGGERVGTMLLLPPHAIYAALCDRGYPRHFKDGGALAVADGKRSGSAIHHLVAVPAAGRIDQLDGAEIG